MTVERELGELRGLLQGISDRYDDGLKVAEEHRKLVTRGFEGLSARMTRVEARTAPVAQYVEQQKIARERRHRIMLKASAWFGGTIITAGTAHFGGLVDRFKWW